MSNLKRADPTTEILLIDPDLARRMLEQNTDNRPVRRGSVMALVATLKEGRWQLTHQGIAFNNAGVLVDGQHRLLAIVESGIPARCLVTRGLDPAAREGMDLHVRRSMGDLISLSVDRVSNTIICRILRGYAALTQANGLRLSRNPDWFREQYEKFGPSLEWAALSARLAQRQLSRQDILCAMFGYHHKHQDRAEDFCEKFVKGEGLRAGDPELAAREMFMRGSLHRSDTDARRYWKLVRCTQAHHDRERLTKVYEASFDWIGNENRAAIEERALKGHNGGLATKNKWRQRRSSNGDA